MMRKYEIVHLTPDNQILDITRLAPAMVPFEDCFAALGRGALIPTECGPVAVEDLLPGDRIVTARGTTETLLWHGAMTVVPNAQNSRPEMGTMTRVTAEAFGPARPSPDLVLGPAARMVHRGPGVRTLTGADAALVPVRDFIDHHTVIELAPVAPVQCYQLGFAEHETLRVNGVEIETLHPGAVHTLRLGEDMRNLLASLFPHMDRLEDFGPMRLPRLKLRDLDIFETA